MDTWFSANANTLFLLKAILKLLVHEKLRFLMLVVFKVNSIPWLRTLPIFFIALVKPEEGAVDAFSSRSRVVLRYQSMVNPIRSSRKPKSRPRFHCSVVSHFNFLFLKEVGTIPTLVRLFSNGYTPLGVLPTEIKSPTLSFNIWYRAYVSYSPTRLLPVNPQLALNLPEETTGFNGFIKSSSMNPQANELEGK